MLIIIDSHFPNESGLDALVDIVTRNRLDGSGFET
jgi:hypothetical protein